MKSKHYQMPLMTTACPLTLALATLVPAKGPPLPLHSIEGTSGVLVTSIAMARFQVDF